jgi:streptomycin 6-kinase
MLHGDLHFGNILRSRRERWLTIDPKGWFGSAAFDAFTVVAGGREQLGVGDGLYAALVRRVSRFAAAAQVDLDLALACCQARAVSSYLYQLTVPRVGFDAEFLRLIALGANAR